MKTLLTATASTNCGADTPVREKHHSNSTPGQNTSRAPEGHPRIAQRFSAGKWAQNNSSPVGTTDSAQRLCRSFASKLNPTWPQSPRRALHALILIAAVFLFLGASDNDARFKDLGHRMMCTCGCGQVLLECNHVGCQSSEKMRNQLLAAMEKGDNDDLILQGFVQDYGPTVLAAPTVTGFNLVSYIVPFAVLALGIALAVYIVRSWKNRPEPALADGIFVQPGSNLDEFRERARKETDV